MAKGIKINNGGAEALILLAGIVIIGFLLACAPAHTTRSEEPGFYGITSRWNNGYEDVNGEVGHRLYVDGPRAKCLPSHNWSANTRIISGSLPPGTDFQSNSSGIEGIPTERGHWVVKLKMDNITCEGMNYDQCCSFEQELRFHITGTGKVIQ